MRKQILSGIMVAAGLTAAALLYPWLGRLSARLGVNRVSTAQVNRYIRGSQTITLSFASYTYTSAYYKDLLRTQSMRSENYLFYDSLYRKYFDIKTIGGIEVLDGLLDATRHRKFTATVNMAELNSSAYGLPQQPVPVLRFTVQDDGSWNAYAKSCKADLERVNQNYTVNVRNYLTYFMPAKAFEQLLVK